MPTRLPETVDAYSERFNRLSGRCARQIGKVPSIRELVEWLDRGVQEGLWAPATFRLYKAAVAFGAEMQMPTDPDTEAAIVRLKSIVCYGRKLSPGSGYVRKVKPSYARTSGKKQKSFPPDDVIKVLELLTHEQPKEFELTIGWIEVGVMTGMRPTEHLSAHIVQGLSVIPFKTALRIRNAKNTNGRSHGEFRHLGLDHVSPAELGTIKRHLVHLRERTEGLALEMRCSAGKAFEALQRTAASRLAAAGRRLWPRRAKRPTLYSARHQFIADCKAAGIVADDIAAMVGHGSADTAEIHYARASSGRNPVHVEPNPAEALRVRPSRPSRGDAPWKSAAKKPKPA